MKAHLLSNCWSLFLMSRKTLSVALSILLLHCATASADWKDSIDYTKLVNEFGSIEDGAGILISQGEADIDPNPNVFTYMPNLGSGEFSGKTIVDGSGLSSGNVSGHANNMANHFYGNNLSVAGGVTDITMYEANDYANRILGFGSGTDPLAQNFSVQNHSWVGFGLSTADAENLLQRMDFVVNQNEISIQVGLNNGSGNSHPQLFGQAYNVVSVGRTDANHSRGFSSLYGPGRLLPDVVMDANTTSLATARTSSVVTVLHHKATNLGNTDASRTEVIKAALMAGATKEEFPGWSRTQSRPLDSVYGAGEVNIYNSYHILDAGETDGVTNVPATGNVGVFGWDYGESIAPGTPLYYNIEVDSGSMVEELSVLLTWNIEVTDTDAGAGFSPTTALADMSLRLYDSTSSPLGFLMDASLSPVDNVEHIFWQNLATGLYTLEVTSDRTTDFALAWRGVVVPEPGMAWLLALVSMGLLGYRLRIIRLRLARICPSIGRLHDPPVENRGIIRVNRNGASSGGSQMDRFIVAARAIAIGALVCVLSPHGVFALDDPRMLDTVHLKTGGSIQGHVEQITEGRQVYYLVRTPEGAEIKLKKSQARWERVSETDRQYHEKRALMADTVQAHEEMQLWCREHNLRQEREYHLLRIIQIEPDHEDARAVLGYDNRDGRWVHRDQFMLNNGYIKERGQWRLPVAVALDEREDRIDEIKTQWLKDLRNWRAKLNRGDQQYLEKIQSATHPLAITGLLDLLEDEKNQNMKLEYLEVIGNIQTYDAQKVLTTLAMSSPERDVRERCISLLKQPHFSQAGVVSSLAGFLRPTPSTPNDNVNHAAYIVGEMEHPSGVRPLIDALVTMHKIKTGASPGQMTLNKDGTGGGGLSMNNNKTHIDVPVRNSSVLSALKRLTGGVDFGYNEDAWLAWYVSQTSLGVTDLRRDR